MNQRRDVSLSSRQRSLVFIRIRRTVSTRLTNDLSVFGEKSLRVDRFVAARTLKTVLMKLFSVELTKNFAGEKRFVAAKAARPAFDLTRQTVETTVFVSKKTLIDQRFVTMSAVKTLTMIQIVVVHGDRLSVEKLFAASFTTIAGRTFRRQTQKARLDLLQTRLTDEFAVFLIENFVDQRRSTRLTNETEGEKPVPFSSLRRTEHTDQV